MSFSSNFLGSSSLSLSSDPFEDFDPRNSPHSYSKDNASNENAQKGQSSMDITKQFSSSVNKMSSGGDNERGATMSNSRPIDYNEPQSTSVNNNESSANPFADFDPRVSPHMYVNGIPTDQSSSTTTTQTNKNKIGILLIDHGSRKEASNDLLHHIASLYQNSSRCPPHFIVKAAHMEIASPSIEDALRQFLLPQQNNGDEHVQSVKQIICHPYFLSPGRHVTEDIPQLVEEAKRNILNENMGLGDIQIITTPHTGSGLNVMVNAIANIVERSVKSDLSMADWNSGSNDELGGFFGDVMKMMEEQIANDEK